jgi:hypothetical protein
MGHCDAIEDLGVAARVMAVRALVDSSQILRVEMVKIVGAQEPVRVGMLVCKCVMLL